MRERNGNDEDDDFESMRRIVVVVGDGMCEGFSRVRRGINRVRSPRRSLLVTTWPFGVPSKVAEEDIRPSVEFA